MPSSITSCTLCEKQDLAGEFNLDRQRSYRLEWDIITTGVMGPISLYIGALLASPDPLIDIWGTYSCLGDTDLDAYCNKISTKKLDLKKYKAYADFATLARGRDPGEATINPLLRPVRYRGAKLVATKAVTSDNEGKPITTSAREEFDEALEQEISYAAFLAVRNVPDLDTWVNDMATYVNSVNNATYRGLSARKWWCMDIELSDQIFESGVAYYQESWQVALNLDTWDEQLLDRGWKVLDNAGRQINAKDDQGNGLTAPILLDGTGKKLASDADPVARKFKVKREVSWGSLPV
jgi:hypothetical protein